MPIFSPYRFLDTGASSAALNMAIDEAILTFHLRGETPPTLRAFSWERPAISLGRFQDVEREILTEECAARGIDLVRRPTGGRAVLHVDEFTYSVITSTPYGTPSGVVAAYSWLAQGIIAALEEFGIYSEVSTNRVSKQQTAACFSFSTQADLTSNGRKLVGSAQVWKENSVLQQGTIPLEGRGPLLFSLLKYPTEEARQMALASYQEATASVLAFAPRATWEAVRDAFARGFSAALGVPFEPLPLTESERGLAEELAATKYAVLDWRQAPQSANVG
ncbi:MAG TPA: biotin/lipoate A/B protein ligase family protein [Ktedonobacterales bacterium]|jgi:lipoate-protein ligase A